MFGSNSETHNPPVPCCWNLNGEACVAAECPKLFTRFNVDRLLDGLQRLLCARVGRAHFYPCFKIGDDRRRQFALGRHLIRIFAVTQGLN